MNAADEIQPLLAALRDLRPGGRRAALITLTRTHGATFRRVGTRMLVYEDGATVCELSGGCPQRDIIGHAMEAMACGVPRRVRYDGDTGLDVLMEMGCGGELEVLVEPLDGSSDLDYVAALSACLEQRREGLLATAFACDGEVMAARHALWCGDGLVHNGLDDPSLTAAVLACARTVPERPRSEVVSTAHGDFDVLVERIVPPPALVVIGSSTTARALLAPAAMLGWSTVLVDFDPERLRSVPVPAGTRAICAQPAELVDAVRPDAATSVVVMTHHLHKDADYLAALGDVPLAYLGLLGARGRVRRVIDLATTDRDIHGPVGLDIGAESPSEIALSIIAEILAATRGRRGGSLRGATGTVG